MSARTRRRKLRRKRSVRKKPRRWGKAGEIHGGLEVVKLKP